MQTERVTVTLPAELLRRLERLRRKQGASRSAAVARAIRAWVDRHEVDDDERRYIEGYLREPERLGEVGAVAEAIVANWEPWE